MLFYRLLGVPPIPNATEVAQKDGVIELLIKWGVSKDVIGIVFDTTASNTGIRAGCAKLIESALQRAILWLACRHHVYELHIRYINLYPLHRMKY